MSTTPLHKEALDTLVNQFDQHRKSSIKGLHEDASVIAYGPTYTLVSSTHFIEGVDFDLQYAPLQHVGYKAVIASLANLIAMNGQGEQLIVKISLNNKFNYQAIETLYNGIQAACQQYTLDLIGNEISTCLTGLTITTTTVGSIDPTKICYRSNARPYDVVCVTGNLGAAYLGLQILIREKDVLEATPTTEPLLQPYQYLITRQLKPNLRLNIIQLLAERGITPTSMIHVKEGLAPAIRHICQQSAVGMTILEDKLPIDQQASEVAEMFQLSPTICAMHGGEDYEILFTIPGDKWPSLEDQPLIHAIGYVTEAAQGAYLISSSHNKIAITAPGWEESA